jgi:aminomethyltransferase
MRPEGRAPVRDGAAVLAPAGPEIGTVTSGGFGPTVGAPIAMGYVSAPFAASETPVSLRGRRGPEPARVAALPFVPHRYLRARS